MSTAVDDGSALGGQVQETWEYEVSIAAGSDGGVLASCEELGIRDVWAPSEDEALAEIARLISVVIEESMPSSG